MRVLIDFLVYRHFNVNNFRSSSALSNPRVTRCLRGLGSYFGLLWVPSIIIVARLNKKLDTAHSPRFYRDPRGAWGNNRSARKRDIGWGNDGSGTLAWKNDGSGTFDVKH
jgi:hypothetical protein